MTIQFRFMTQIDHYSQIEKMEIADFLHTHLDEYSDPVDHISSAIEYAIGGHPSKGGFVLTVHDEEQVIGAVVINKTHMGGYIPENILVYLAIHHDYRKQGIGQQLLERTLDYTSGDVALHVEADNPARKLYEKMGFENKYLELRFRAKK